MKCSKCGNDASYQIQIGNVVEYRCATHRTASKKEIRQIERAMRE